MNKPNSRHNGPRRDHRREDEDDLLRVISLVRSGHAPSFAEIVKRYRHQVAAVAYRIVGDYDDAADITQQVFLRVFQNIEVYDESRRFYTWLHRITINASIDHLRKDRRHRHEPLDNCLTRPGHERESPESDFNIDRLRDHITAATERLEGKQKTAFLMRDIEGCQIDSIAKVMNMPEATVRWYIYRARSRIRKELTRKCPHLLQLMGIV